MHHRKILYLVVLATLIGMPLLHGIGERLWLTTNPVQSNYGIAYNSSNNRVYFCKAYRRYIYIVSSDSLLTSYGTIPTPNNDSACVDLKYCAYDNTFWVLNQMYKRIYKVTTAGAVLRTISISAVDYATGLAWDNANRQLYVADRRTTGGQQAYIYVFDTMGVQVRRMNHPAAAWYGPRGLAYLPANGPNPATLLNAYTFFNSGSTLDSGGVFALNPATGAVLNFFRCVPNDSMNIRGVEVDPRNGNYWVNLFQYGT
jgi:DNA-binding beta-propeller fold protein YncE